MRNLLIGICENSDIDAELLIQHLKIAEAALDTSFEIHTYSTGNDFLHAYCPVFDIIFLALPVPDMDSNKLIAQLRQRDSMVQIILLSQSSDFYHLGYEYGAKNYFTKPLWYRTIFKEIKKLIADENILKRPYLWISDQQGDYKLYLHILRYIETCNRQLKFHYGNKEIYICGKLSDFEAKLPSSSFFRCNNSYIVNVNYIEKIQKDINRYTITLISGESIPLSRNKKRELKEIIQHF